MASQRGLEERIERLESIERIARLIAGYARGADRQNDPAMMRPLYTDDAIWESEGFFRLEGGDRLTQELGKFGRERIPWSLHYNTSPIVDLAPDGKSATMVWYVWEVANVTPEGGGRADPHFVGGWYDSLVVKTGEGWKFKHIKLFAELFAPKNAPEWHLEG